MVETTTGSSTLEATRDIIPPPEMTIEGKGQAPGRHRMVGKKVLVVGGGQRQNDFDPHPPVGNGRAICLLLAREGADVAVADISQSAADETSALIQNEGVGSGHTIVGDVSTEEGCKSIVKEALLLFGGQLDGLVLVVGILDPGPTFTKGTAAYWDTVLNVNLRAHYLLLQEALPHIDKSSTGGSAVSISSVAAYLPISPEPAYHASKSALQTLIKNIAYQFAPRVRVNTVVPGFIDTPVARMGGTRIKEQKNASDVPLSRLGTGWDVAYAVLWLLSGESSYVTAQDIIVDGGVVGSAGKGARKHGNVQEAS